METELLTACEANKLAEERSRKTSLVNRSLTLAAAGEPRLPSWKVSAASALGHRCRRRPCLLCHGDSWVRKQNRAHGQRHESQSPERPGRKPMATRAFPQGHQSPEAC